MRAMQVTAYDQPFVRARAGMPVPAAGEVLIKVKPAALTLAICDDKGTYQQSPILALFNWGWNWRAAFAAVGEGVT